MSAPPCFRCKNDEHEQCGGPESGCGCAAEGHGQKRQPMEFEVTTRIFVRVNDLVANDKRTRDDVEESVVGYLRTFIPDQAPNDQIHIHNFQVLYSKPWREVAEQVKELNEAKAMLASSIRQGVKNAIAKWPGGAIQTLEDLIMAEMPLGLRGTG